MIDSRQLARIRRRVLGGHLHGLGYEPSKKEYRAKVGLQLRYVSFDVAKYGKAFDVSIALHFDFLPPFDFPVWPGARVPAEMCGQLCAFQRLVRSHSGSQYYECGETEAAAAILVFFLHKLVSREFAPYLRSHDYYPIRDIERLLAAFERNINDHPGAAVLYGQPVVFALICRAVWDGIARASTSSASFCQRYGPAREHLWRQPGACRSTYARAMGVRDFLLRRKLNWQPEENPGQHYAEEMTEFLVTAKRMFSDSPFVLNGLSQYELAIADLLRAE